MVTNRHVHAYIELPILNLVTIGDARRHLARVFAELSAGSASRQEAMMAMTTSIRQRERILLFGLNGGLHTITFS